MRARHRRFFRDTFLCGGAASPARLRARARTAPGGREQAAEDIANLRTRNAKGEMVPIGSMVTVEPTYGPDPVVR
ncbi:hypothetical protein WL01_13205 [Burkholderia ubonensis]|nr:hypothetical protein WJ79_25015 [Burkholderia ubonensis]KVX19530.1 hypothetical protein WL01_13205 [Burkholderia ubonensis]KWB33656.1 hypothetical protein WL33_01405 [Burkholderia ubonensis]KWC31902.1 hypothetical protein WL50_02145 [Burkholderia ubonensis]KWC70547.1 hypothetical protein WL53_28920 [Burkholderia ubonensis]